MRWTTDTFKCDFCQEDFETTCNAAKMTRHRVKHGGKAFCSEKCRFAGLNFKQSLAVNCDQCGKISKKSYADFSKRKNHFCSHSCNAKYQNSHKTHGASRSKLEKWLEEQLTVIFKDVEIHYNRRDTILSELDIYIPSLKLAFELNGIFHYEPIFGAKKLSQTQNNDRRKFQACLEKGIEFCIIDSSKLVYFKPANAQKYLDIIVKIIHEKFKFSGFESNEQPPL